jgi:beta-galactosidase/beta-glucuronidase
VARRDYYRKLADMTGGKTGDLIAVLPERARFRIDPRDDGRYGHWYAPDFNDADWQTLLTTVPFYGQGYRDPQGYPYLGAMWYRMDADVPAAAKGRSVFLYVPAIEVEAWVWVNGKFVGHRGYRDAYERPNPIDMDVTQALAPGKRNRVAIRVHTSFSASQQAAGLTSRAFLYAPKPAAAAGK